MRTCSVLFVAILECVAACVVASAAGDKPNASLAAMSGLSESDTSDVRRSGSNARSGRSWRGENGEQKSCVGCHTGGSDENKSPLLLTGVAADDFVTLLADGYFDAGNPMSITAKLSHKKRKLQMPPEPAPAWPDSDLNRLRAFVDDLSAHRGRASLVPDEVFPPSLLVPFGGRKTREGPGNTFLSFRQLKGKIRTIFQDDWRRNERDLFQENLEQFGGADFVRRFDESTKASPSYLSALDGLSRDVASKAFLNASGPFARVHTDLPPPGTDSKLDALYRENINTLFRAVLYRDATDAERDGALAFFKDLAERRDSLAREDYELSFELQVEDEQGMRTTQAFSIPVTNDRRGLFQERVDEVAAGGDQLLSAQTLAPTFHFDPTDSTQTLRVTNTETDGNVSVHGYAIRRVDDDHQRIVTVKDKGVQLEGAWQFVDRDGFTTCEDGNDNKGESQITFPVLVDEPGAYQVALLYRKSGGDLGGGRGGGRGRPRPENATNVLVEVVSHDPSRLELPRELPKPPPGEARFLIDQTVDTQAWWDLKTAFQFTCDDHYVEVNNTGTKRQVVADAVRFTRADGKPGQVIIDDPKADGREQWQKFTKFPFKPYNITGAGTLTDDGQKKGELALRYVPTKAVENWEKERFQRVGVGFPGQQKNETRVPVVVHAAASSPIVRLQYPKHAHADAEVVLDASGTFNIQNTPLTFTWVQVGGPKVDLSDPHAPRATFEARVMRPTQAAWEGLARALIKHPDFLFSRPVALAQVTEPHARARLQLEKIAIDLIGRPPNAAELARLDAGASLAEMVDAYLQSPEFRDFYYHRIRLYLESQGTEEEDEPVRLWAYVAFNDLPFQEILTANYTVAPDMTKQERPAYHGKTGILTTKGFIHGKPGLPHFNYAAQVAEKFLGYVFEVPPEIVAARDGSTAVSTTDPKSLCYSCHKLLTPLAFQREAWTDNGEYRPERNGKPIDDTDQDLVDSYPFKGKGMEAFALQAQKKERFIRTIINTHFVFLFGREMRLNTDERVLYKRLWDTVHSSNFSIRSLIRELVLSPEYLDGTSAKANLDALTALPEPAAEAPTNLDENP